MSDTAVSRAEVERSRLQRLHVLAQLPGWFPSENDWACYYCGLRHRAPHANLCATCEERRQLLQTRYPDVQPVTPETRSPIPKQSRAFTALGAIQTPREWTPYKSDSE